MKSSVSRSPHAEANTERDPPVVPARVHVLLLEDDASDAELAARALTAAGFAVSFDRVETEAAFNAALARGGYDLVLSDYNLPSFNGLRALEIFRASGIDLPFVLVSGALGIDKAVESIKLGANDYVMKGHLERLAPAVRGALRDAAERRQRARAAAAETERVQRLLQDEAYVAGALAKVGEELISSRYVPALLERLCRVTAEVLHCAVSYTFIVHEDSGTLSAVAAHGEMAERWETIRALDVRMIPGVAEEFRRGGLVRHGAAGEVPSVLRNAFALTDSISVPLWCGEQLTGIQIAGMRDGGEFTARDERVARGIAQLASLAVENARLVEQLENANRLKSDLLATMSHELRTPLNVILGYNELLLDEVFGTLTPEQAASLDRVGMSARELLELINATLDISRLETGRAALALEDIDPAALLQDIESETRALREKPGVESVWRIVPNLPRIRSDLVKLKVLLKNLIANAIKFTDHGSVTIAAQARDGWIEFSVADTGTGMSSETQAVIFEPFRQGDSSATRLHGGVGLGLYIVSRLLEMLSGRIEVESAVGVGSTFRVRIPVNATHSARVGARDSKARG